MNTKIVFGLCILFLTTSRFLQAENDVTISGIVTDAQNHPVAGAALFLKEMSTNKKLFTFTGADGKFEFMGLKERNYELRSERRGFQSSTAPMEFQQHESVRIVVVILRSLKASPESEWPATAQCHNSPTVISRERRHVS